MYVSSSNRCTSHHANHKTNNTDRPNPFNPKYCESEQRFYGTRIADTGQITRLQALEGQGGNKGRSNTGSILGGQNADLVLFLGLPAKDLAEGLGAAGLEMRVLGEDRAIGADVAGMHVLFLADGRDTAGRETGSASADELCEAADQLQLGLGGFDTEGFLEGVAGLLQVLEGVLFDDGEEGGVEDVGLAQERGILAVEDDTGLVVDDVEEAQAEDLAEVEAGGHLLKGLLARAWGVAVDDEVVLGQREDNVLVVEGAVLAIDGDGHVRGEAQVGDLGDGTGVLHVGGVDAGAEDAADLHLWVSVVGGDKGSGGVVDQGSNFDGETLGT